MCGLIGDGWPRYLQHVTLTMLQALSTQLANPARVFVPTHSGNGDLSINLEFENIVKRDSSVIGAT